MSMAIKHWDARVLMDEHNHRNIWWHNDNLSTKTRKEFSAEICKIPSIHYAFHPWDPHNLAHPCEFDRFMSIEIPHSVPNNSIIDGISLDHDLNKRQYGIAMARLYIEFPSKEPHCSLKCDDRTCVAPPTSPETRLAIFPRQKVSLHTRKQDHTPYLHRWIRACTNELSATKCSTGPRRMAHCSTRIAHHSTRIDHCCTRMVRRSTQVARRSTRVLPISEIPKYDFL